MKRKGPASLRGSLIARKGEASPAGGGPNENQQLRGTLTDASNGRPPVSVPMPPGVVEGRLGYRLQADPRSAPPPVSEARTARTLLDEPRRDGGGVDSLRDYRPAFELLPVSESRDGVDAARVASAPDGHSRSVPAARTEIDGTNTRLQPEGAAAVRRHADANGVGQNANGADVPRPRPSGGEADRQQLSLRRGSRQGDAVRARSGAAVNGAKHARRRSGRARGHHRQRGRSRNRVGRLALLATVILLVFGAGYYGRLGAPQPMLQVVQETLINAFGSAVPLLAEAVGVSEGALGGEAEKLSATVGADVQLATVRDLPADAADLRSDDATDSASVQSIPAAVRPGEPPSAGLPGLSTKVVPGPVREEVPAVALAAVRTDLRAGVLLNAAVADKLPIPLTPSSAVTIDALPPTGLPRENEPQSVTTARLEPPVGLAVASDVTFLLKAVVVEAPLSNKAASSESEAGVRLGVPSGRAAIPISKPRDLVRREAGDVPGPAVLSSRGAYAVQLASYRSSELAADAAAKLSERHLEQLGSGTARVEPGPNGLYRVMSMRMERRGDAVSLCDRLKTRGQDCLVVQR